MIRDCTVQLTIFADGEPCIKPLWIFKAQDKELQTEKRGSMIQESWSSSKRTRGATRKSSSSCSEICRRSQTCLVNQAIDFQLIYDAQRAQTTERVKTVLTQECQTTLGLVPYGATSKVQPLDVTFNAEFKKSVDRLRLDQPRNTFRKCRALYDGKSDCW